MQKQLKFKVVSKKPVLSDSMAFATLVLCDSDFTVFLQFKSLETYLAKSAAAGVR